MGGRLLRTWRICQRWREQNGRERRSLEFWMEGRRASAEKLLCGTLSLGCAVCYPVIIAYCLRWIAIDRAPVTKYEDVELQITSYLRYLQLPTYVQNRVLEYYAYRWNGKFFDVCHLEDGGHMGEVALVLEEQVRIANVVAVESCEIYRLERGDFKRAVAPYPDILLQIERIAEERLQNFLEMKNKRQRRRATQRTDTEKEQARKLSLDA